MNNEIIIFEDQNVKLEVNMQDDTVWLSQAQMAKLFASSRTNIVDHINKIYADEELSKISTCRNFRQVRKEGTRIITRNIPFYNLDMIISVGYRVNSKQGIIFRRWATKVLKDYMLKGYAVNQKRLNYLEKCVKLIDIASRSTNVDDTQEILKIINNYTKALDLLDDYDYKRIKRVRKESNDIAITYKECINIINTLKFNNKSKLFGREKDKGFESIIKDIYTSYDGKDLYPTSLEKGANLLYLIIKNHAFIDGNKRIGATIFIYYLSVNKMLYKDGDLVIDNNTLASLTLLIAMSNPKEKDTIIDLITNLLN